MSPDGRGARLLRRLPPLAWLVLVWVLLWGTWSWGNLVTGVLVALVVTTVLPLPPVALGGRLRPWGSLLLLAHLGAQLVTASAQVAGQALRPGPPPPGAVVAVQLRNRSDLLTTMTAEVLSLVPGSLVIEVSRSRRVLYAHVLRARDLDEVEAFRRSVLDLEARVVRAIGSDDAVAALSAGDAR